MTLNAEKVVALVDKWVCALGLGPEWAVGVKINETKKFCNKKDRDAMAFTVVREAYFEADIAFNAWHYINKDSAFLDLVCCHEVLHILMNKMGLLIDEALGDNTELSDIIQENVIEHVSRALIKLQDAPK